MLRPSPNHGTQRLPNDEMMMMYCGHLLHDFRKSALRRLSVGYNHSFRFLMKFSRNCSASGMFVSNNCVHSFMEMWRKYIYMVLPSA